MENDDKTELKIDLTDDMLSRPPLIRERQSDYGMFDQHFEHDVKNWFQHIDNRKRAELIEDLALLIKTNIILNTPYPRSGVQSPNYLNRNSSIPRLGRQISNAGNLAPPKLNPFFEEELTPPKVHTPSLEPRDTRKFNGINTDQIFESVFKADIDCIETQPDNINNNDL